MLSHIGQAPYCINATWGLWRLGSSGNRESHYYGPSPQERAALWQPQRLNRKLPRPGGEEQTPTPNELNWHGPRGRARHMSSSTAGELDPTLSLSQRTREASIKALFVKSAVASLATSWPASSVVKGLLTQRAPKVPVPPSLSVSLGPGLCLCVVWPQWTWPQWPWAWPRL